VDHFQNLYQYREDTEQSEINEDFNRTMAEDEYYNIILRDVKEEMENLKNRKVAILDDIKNEILKCERSNI